MIPTEYLYPTVTVIVALSGWGKVLYDYLQTEPKIKGQVFQVMRGFMDHPDIHGQKMTAFTTYLYLINQRRNAIHILDYELAIEVKSKWLRLKRVYGIHRLKNLDFKDSTGQDIKIDKFPDKLIYRKGSPVEYGTPLHGWIVFVGDPELWSVDISRYKLTCIDAFRGRHEIVTNKEELANIYLLADLADFQIPKSAIIDNP